MKGFKILGIDPGLNISGYGLIEVWSQGFAIERVRLCEAGVVRTKRSGSLESRLAELYEGITEVFDQHPIHSMAIEQLYSHYERPRTAILMGHARGVLCLAAAQRDIAVHNYLPTKIKKLLTGNGRAPKEQMQKAVREQLRLKRTPEPADVADALATAICHAYSVQKIAAA